jgi:hypothetical protein
MLKRCDCTGVVRNAAIIDDQSGLHVFDAQQRVSPETVTISVSAPTSIATSTVTRRRPAARCRCARRFHALKLGVQRVVPGIRFGMVRPSELDWAERMTFVAVFSLRLSRPESRPRWRQ